jgi:succinyl-diaminopimelate desuccinylase
VDHELGDLLLELLAMPCVTGSEGPIADWLVERYGGRGEDVRRSGHSVVVGRTDDARPTVLLVGHIDVVPPTEEDRDARREGERIIGRGSSDMKSGLAVAMHCFEDQLVRAGPYNLMLLAYAGEEGPHEGNELGPLLAEMPELCAAELAVVLEPTDLATQLGCMGGLHAEVTFTGRPAHSARPWHGENALTKAGEFLTELHNRSPEDVEVDGLVFREVVTATRAWTEPVRESRNVVPDEFTVNCNYRFAPDKSLEAAEERVRALVGERAQVAIVDRAPPGPPRREAPLVAQFLNAVDAAVEPKQAWTDVARFAERGVPALNYGPGLTGQAHQAGEYVPEENLRRAREGLARFLAG